MTEDEFLALGRAGHNRVPLRLETLADLDTPLSIYLKLANRPNSYLLESVIGGERFGRYSIVGLPARERLEVRGHRVTLQRGGQPVEERDADDRSEERRVGEEGRSRWSPYHLKKKKKEQRGWLCV